ncbi:MAG TPA: TonB-dependent receptor plug domain-containing protein, partial [Candidatus Baltobacteraceae bacterium]|nr:TonB-dependent receptor plug domain-containing protein [Candidatus Baltobacteraceae bacterium]
MNQRTAFRCVSTACIFLSRAFFCWLVLCAVNADADTNLVENLADMPLEQLMQLEVPTVVSASKFEQKSTEAPSSVTVITSDEIKRYGYRTLADILASVQGFYVSYDRNYAFLGARGV